MYKHFYEELYKRKTWTKIIIMNANNHAILVGQFPILKMKYGKGKKFNHHV